MQCKDIPTLPILKFVNSHGGIGCSWFFGDERDVRNAMPDGIDKKLVHAKMRKLISKGFISGCNCGCRGDFEITKRGVEIIASHSNDL